MYGNDPRSSVGSNPPILPAYEWATAGRVQRTRWLRRRHNLLALGVLVASSFFVFYYLANYHGVTEELVRDPEQEEQPLPPLYPEYHHAELALPHHDRKNPFADGRKYLWIASHTQCQ